MSLTVEKLVTFIDHTRLKPETKRAKILELCDEALAYEFAAVCINSVHVEYAAELLQDSDVDVCAVVGFPLGAMLTEAKAFEAREAVRRGADEIDMVINVGALRDENYDLVRQDIGAVVSASDGAIVKVILETGLLSKEEIVQACRIAVDSGLDFVKTSTGFGPRGASLEDIQLMKKAVGGKVKIKASGGIRDLESAQAMIRAGAHRLGTSSGVEIILAQESPS